MARALHTTRWLRAKAADYPKIVALLAVNALVGFIAIIYGFDSAIPLSWRNATSHMASIVTLTGLIGLLLATCRPKFWLGSSALPSWLAPALCLGQVGLSIFFNLPTWLAIPAIVLAFLGATFLGLRVGPGAATFWSIGWGVALWVGSILAHPVASGSADMLPVIEHAIDVFRAGGNPYVADYRAITENPFFYPPMQWLVFLPARVLGIDIRVISLLSAGMMLALVELFRRSFKQSLRAGAYPLMLSPLALPMMQSGQVWPYWLAMLCMMLFILRNQLAWGASVAALAIGMRQTALLPVAAIFAALIGRTTLVTLMGATLAGVATLAVTIAPFASSAASWHVMLVDGPRLALVQAHLQGNPANQIAASNLLDWAGLSNCSTWVEAALGLLTVVLTRRAMRFGIAPALAVAGLGYALTVSANPYLHRYYYVAGLLLAGVALVAAHNPNHLRFQTNVAETA